MHCVWCRGLIFKPYTGRAEVRKTSVPSVLLTAMAEYKAKLESKATRYSCTALAFLTPQRASLGAPAARRSPVWVLTWFRRRVTVRKAFRHRWHACGLSLVWVFTWRFKLATLAVVNTHRSQQKACSLPAGRRHSLCFCKNLCLSSNFSRGRWKYAGITQWPGCTNLWIY